MSNVYDFNPSGVIPLARLIQSQIPATASPDTPEPLPTPGGGLPAGAPTGPYSPSGLGSLIGNIGTGLAGLARSYFAAGQPSVWGQPSPGATQGPDEAGMIAGAQQPPQPDTTGAGGPAGPSQMQPQPQTQFPPSPIKPRTDLPTVEPPASEKPPTADRAPPRQEPYIPSRRDTRPNAWGRPDLVEQGAVRYPGLLPGPFMPQPHEWRGVMQGSAQFLGNLGSGVVAPLARALAGLDPAYHKAKNAGEEHRAKMAASSFALYAKQLAMKQALESREYGEAFAAYGPRLDEKGRTVPGDEDALRDAILTIAARNHDDKIPAVLSRGGLPAVERLIRERDAHGKDASKVLIQMQRRNALVLQEQRIAANRAKARASQEAQYPFLIGGGGGTPTGAMAPASPGGAAPGAEDGDEHQFDPHFGGSTKTEPPADTADTAADTSDEKVEDEKPESDDSTEDKQSQAEPEQKQAAAEQPDQQAEAAAAAPAESPQRPIRLAARDTGTVSDAPQPGALPTAEPLPRTAAAQAPTATPGAAPAAGTPAAMGAAAPVPSLQPQPKVPPGAVPMMQEPPAQEPPATDGAAAAPGYEWQPSRSQAMERAANTTIDTPRGPMRPNTQIVETLARQMVNGTIKIQDLRNYPEWVKGLARARGDEILADMNRIAADPKIKGEAQVLAALQKVNPEFGAALKGYVDGDFSVPTSAWSNPGYRNRTIALGKKADPGFTEYTAKTRAATYKAFATGQEAKNLTSVATAYRHLNAVIDDLQRRPGLWTSVMGTNRLTSWMTSEEGRKAFGELSNAVHTANVEYERALLGGKPAVAGIKEQEKEMPLILGDTTVMLSNARSKVNKLRDRMTELQNQFVSGTGTQPQAMVERFRAAAATPERQQEANQLRELQTSGRGGAPSRRPAAAPKGDVIDYRTYFGP